MMRICLVLYITLIKEPTSHVDDEYANAGIVDPKILITTSRDPSSRLIQFSKELKLLFPNDVTDLVIIHEHRGVPDGLIISHFPYGPTAYFTLNNVVLRHDIPDQPPVSEQYPHLIFDKFTSKLGNRVQNILKYLFPVPKEDAKRVLTFSNESDYISFRHHVFHKTGNKIELMEVGPRFEMQLYQLTLGTIEIPDADIEWTLRPYHNTAKKREFL
jgi:U3 small nucleolar ribonucleoprotein protein IMP4